MFRSFAAFLALLSLTSAHAAGPMTTQSADVLDRGDCRGEAQWQRAEFRSAWANTATTGRGLALDCGIGWGTELGLSAARFSGPQQAGGDTRGLNGKTRLWQSKDRTGALALTYWISEENRGSGWQRANRAVGLAAMQTLGQRHRVHAHLMSDVVGFGSSEKAEAWGLAYEFAATPTVSLMAETYGKQHAKPTQALGLRWTPNAQWELGAMAARPRGENGNGAQSHTVKLTTAYRF